MEHHLSSVSATAPIYWLKAGEPTDLVPSLAEGTDARVILPSTGAFDELRAELNDRGVPYHSVHYWVETELLTGSGRELTVRMPSTAAHGTPTSFDGEKAAAARDAFDAVWRALNAADGDEKPAPVGKFVPPEWEPYLPHPMFNPGQAQAAPSILSGNQNTLVVAPTGAGKTTIGMLAALRTVLLSGRKAAWLVPQRSLTDELDRELDLWRDRGLRVERLSGETSVDAHRVRDADLWVTTTEKFEVLSRTSTLRDALSEVGCVIVDEIHLLGDFERGPVIEALLTRLRQGVGSPRADNGTLAPVRVVGLSATVSNADEVADWLQARLVPITWRPSRLTWQLPTIPAHPDWHVSHTARTSLTTRIVEEVTRDGGSALVFCGSKAAVRGVALAVAATRGIPIEGVRPDDTGQVYRVTRAAGVVLHYKDWERRREAEIAFRRREANVLVATSTVAAGVNLPARAVVVRDTRIGTQDLDVATVQQMFGRAGRIGEGESDGWAYLLVDEAERATWQQRLVAGYTADSRIGASLADHVLAEIVQRRIRTRADAETWWTHTFAYHQGSHSLAQLRRAVDFLLGADYLQAEDRDGEQWLDATELGILTTRVMVSAKVGYQLRAALDDVPLPAGPEDAEYRLIDLLATLVPKLAHAPLAERTKPAATALAAAGGHPERAVNLNGSGPPGVPYTPGDLARAALLTVANAPRLFAHSARHIVRVPYSALHPVLETAPRYLHWLGSQGYLGTLHPWAAITAADLGRRVRWRRCAPERGSGRLLWMCEQMATAVHAGQDLPAAWRAARERGLASPDWTTAVPPRSCRLDRQGYAALLRERVTGADQAEAGPKYARVRCPAGRALVTWQGGAYQRILAAGGEVRAGYPDPSGDADTATATRHREGHGAAVFSRRGDYRATGWLAAFSQIAD